MTRVRPSGSGNRAFWRMVTVSVVLRALAAYGICCLTLAVFDAVRAGGAAALWSNDPSLIPGLLLLAAVAVGVTRASWLLGRAAWHSLAFGREIRVRAARLPPRLGATLLGGASDRLVFLDAEAPFALTYGALRPRVVITAGLVGRLSDAELDAVLAHEREHLRSRDPLKNILARAMLARHFYLPAMAGLRDRFTAGRELSADHAAVTAHGTTPLAGALLKVTAAPAWAAASPSAAMSNDALLEARIRQLETGTEPAPPPTGRMAVLSTIGGALFLAFTVAWSAVIVAHYLPHCLPGLR